MSDARARIRPLTEPRDRLDWPSAALAVLFIVGVVWLGLVLLVHVAAVLT